MVIPWRCGGDRFSRWAAPPPTFPLCSGISPWTSEVDLAEKTCSVTPIACRRWRGERKTHHFPLRSSSGTSELGPRGRHAVLLGIPFLLQNLKESCIPWSRGSLPPGHGPVPGCAGLATGPQRSRNKAYFFFRYIYFCILLNDDEQAHLCFYWLYVDTVYHSRVVGQIDCHCLLIKQVFYSQ